nr:hypothetical protein [Rhizobium laguerreae]
MRILCDYLVIHGFLTKEGGQYRMTPSTRIFLDRNSPVYMGLWYRVRRRTVRNGGSAGLANLSADNPV